MSQSNQIGVRKRNTFGNLDKIRHDILPAVSGSRFVRWRGNHPISTNAAPGVLIGWRLSPKVFRVVSADDGCAITEFGGGPVVLLLRCETIRRVFESWGVGRNKWTYSINVSKGVDESCVIVLLLHGLLYDMMQFTGVLKRAKRFFELILLLYW